MRERVTKLTRRVWRSTGPRYWNNSLETTLSTGSISLSRKKKKKNSDVRNNDHPHNARKSRKKAEENEGENFNEIQKQRLSSVTTSLRNGGERIWKKKTNKKKVKHSRRLENECLIVTCFNRLVNYGLIRNKGISREIAKENQSGCCHGEFYGPGDFSRAETSRSVRWKPIVGGGRFRQTTSVVTVAAHGGY